MEATLVLIAPGSLRLEVAVTVNVFTWLRLMGLKEQQMGRAFRDESLTVQLVEARGGGMCRRLFTSAVYTWANWPFPSPEGAIEGPNKIISLCSRWLPSLPPASFEPSSPLCSLHSLLSYTYFLLLVLPLLSSPLFLIQLWADSEDPRATL